MESANYQFRQTDRVTEVTRIDLIGYQAREQAYRTLKVGVATRKVIDLHRRLNASCRRYGELFNYCWYLRAKKRLFSTWQQGMQGAALLSIGGGQLLQHSRLFFPLLIDEVVSISWWFS